MFPMRQQDSPLPSKGVLLVEGTGLVVRSFVDCFSMSYAPFVHYRCSVLSTATPCLGSESACRSLVALEPASKLVSEARQESFERKRRSQER